MAANLDTTLHAIQPSDVRGQAPKQKELTTWQKVVFVAKLIFTVIKFAMDEAWNCIRALWTTRVTPVQPKKAEAIPLDEQSLETLKTKLNITPAIEAQIKRALEGATDPEVHVVQSGSENIVTLDSAPHIQIRMPIPGAGTTPMSFQGRWVDGNMKTVALFSNRVKAEQVCREEHLEKIKIPGAMLVEVKIAGETTALIIEEKVDFDSHEPSPFLKHPLIYTLEQLTTFVAKTGCTTREWRAGMPIVGEGIQRKVALLDFSSMNSAAAAESLYGVGGLVDRLETEQQIDAAFKTAQQLGVVHPNITPVQAKASRMKDLAENQRLQQFHASKGVSQDSRTPLNMDDLSSLGLDLDEKTRHLGRDISLREVLEDVIAVINQELAKAPEGIPPKQQRRILLNTNEDGKKLQPYRNLGAKDRLLVTEEELPQLWLSRILDALLKKGYLFKVQNHGYGYLVQA